MHLVPHCSGPLHGGRRQDSAPTGQRDLLLPGDHSLDSLACITPKYKLLQKWDYYVILKVSWWWVVCRAENIYVSDKHRDVQKSAHISIIQTSQINDSALHAHQFCFVRSDDRKDTRKMFLWCFVKHTGLKSTHIRLTFQLSVHANLSISD